MSDPRLTAVPSGRLVGIADIAALLGVQRETVDLWRTRDRRGRKEASPMPSPVLPYDGMLTKTPYWDREEVLRWAHATGRIRAVAPSS